MQNKDTAQQPPIPFPNTIPRGLVPGNTWLEESVTFDPTLHLAFEPPSFLVDLNFKKCSYPLEDGAVGGKTAPAGDADHPTATSFPGLAFTGPFRLLSDAGVRQLRAIVDGQANNAAIRQSDARTPLSLRGLGYVSPFVRDLNRSAAVDTILSGLAREPLAAHTMPYNYSQVNVGAIGGDSR